MKPRYLWLDTETTGFDVPNTALLEVGAAIVDDALEVISTFERVVHFKLDAPEYAHIRVKPDARALHTENGLWTDAERSKLSAQEVDLALKAWATAFFECGSIAIGGKTVWFDVRVAELHLPRFAACMSGRQLDTRTLAEQSRLMGFPPLEHAPHPHRALRDVLGDLTDARAYMRRVDPAWPDVVL